MNTASFIIGVVGLAVGVLALFHWTIDLRRRARWREVIAAIQRLEGKVRTQSFDVVIGLADGLVPAAIIALNRRIPEIHFIDAPVSTGLPTPMRRVSTPKASRRWTANGYC